MILCFLKSKKEKKRKTLLSLGLIFKKNIASNADEKKNLFLIKINKKTKREKSQNKTYN